MSRPRTPPAGCPALSAPPQCEPGSPTTTRSGSKYLLLPSSHQLQSAVEFESFFLSIIGANSVQAGGDPLPHAVYILLKLKTVSKLHFYASDSLTGVVMNSRDIV